MRLLLLATMGGALGAGARHLVNVGFARWLGPSFPWSTVFINIFGSLLMGLVLETLVLRCNGSVDLRIFLATGILGGFTTFSAFSMDAVTLIQRGDMASAALYIGGSVMFSILGLYAGLSIARAVLA